MLQLSHISVQLHMISSLLQKLHFYMKNNNCFEDQIELYDWNHFLIWHNSLFTFPFFVFIIQQEILKEKKKMNLNSNTFNIKRNKK